MATLTLPMDSATYHNVKVWNEEYNEHDYVAKYSKRGGIVQDHAYEKAMLYSIFHEVHQRDDWGIVTLQLNRNGNELHAYVENTNLGFSIRPFINNTPYRGEIINGAQTLSAIFGKYLGG